MKMYDFIINAPLSQGLTIPMWSPILAGFPINSPLIGSFLGVVFGFAINYAYQYWKNRNDRNYYMKAITSEIGFCISTLNSYPNILPTDRWEAALYSGILRRFRHDQVAKLSKAYHKIREFNLFMDYWHDNTTDAYCMHHRQEELRTDLEELMEWLNPSLMIKADEAGAYLAIKDLCLAGTHQQQQEYGAS